MRVKNRASEVPALPNTARAVAGELMPTLRRIAADALAVHGYFAEHGEPLEGLSPERYAEMLARIQAVNPPPETATITSLVWMLTDAVYGLIVQLDGADAEAGS
jgi:uncharacterized protein (DUF849 family)